MNSHGRPTNATRGLKGKSLRADLGHAPGAWPLFYSFVVMVVNVAIILLSGSG